MIDQNSRDRAQVTEDRTPPPVESAAADQPAAFAGADAQGSSGGGGEVPRERVDRLAQAARDAYYGAIDGRAVAGEWHTLSEDERLAWRAVAASVADLVGTR